MRKRMAIVLVLYDIIGIQLASAMAILTRFEFRPSTVDPAFVDTLLHYAFLNTFCSLFIFAAYRLYAILWRFASVMDFFNVVKAVLVASAFQFIGMHLLVLPIPRSYIVLYIGWAGLIIVAPRILIRVLRGGRKIPLQKVDKQPTAVMLIGAGEAGNMILNEIKNSQYVEKEVRCIIDDDSKKWGTFLNGVPVVGGRHKIMQYAVRFGIKEIILAVPTIEAHDRKEILNICKQTGCKMSMLPGMYQLINSEVKVSMLRDVQIEDLLGREPVKTDLPDIMQYVEGHRVMVTGGGGSIGSELCRQIAAHNPKRLVIVDIYENNAYDIQQELRRKYPDLALDVLIASVRNTHRMDNIFQKYRPNIVYHAAAHKHVPLMEDSPNEAIKNNVFGTYKTAEAADRYGVEKFVLISTDKAVNPTNIMGASKRMCEMIVQMFARHSKTNFVAVRFGNVLGSNGSVIPLFKKQIAEGGPVTVTHPDIIRYFMTIPEAVSLVLQAGAYAKGGEIFVLDMGEPVKILDLAENLIKLSGYKVGDDIKIEFTGLRPGEKLYEELLMSEEGLQDTANKMIHIGKPIEFDEDEFRRQLDKLDALSREDDPHIKEEVQKVVPTYVITENKNN